MKRNFLLKAAAIPVMLALAMMLIPGYQFSILLCFGLSALLVLFHFLGKYPTPATRTVRMLLCVLIAIGILLGLITLGFILSGSHDPQLPCDHIVVLGAAVHGTEPSLSLAERIRGAYTYLSANPQALAVLCGGQGGGEDITEAACMYRELTQMGIDGSRLLLEEASTSTIENLRFALDVFESATGTRPARIGIVSSEYHLFRAKLFAGELGLESFGIPAKTSHITLRINYYLREVAAVWKFLLFGP